ncbi:hypothetical protein [Ruminococcus flavefaciens]|uniref:hypothetical protein n=1 Tax=Ruminococcus flavefaciens TaxID=1265 RepID=UPI0026ECF501|nr:hypothetical protein [Ruminococcus flavefaciens]
MAETDIESYSLQFEGANIEALLEKMNKTVFGRVKATYRTTGVYQTTVSGLTKISLMTNPVCIVFLTGATASGSLRPYLESCAYSLNETSITFTGYTEDSTAKTRYFNYIIFDAD